MRLLSTRGMVVVAGYAVPAAIYVLY